MIHLVTLPQELLLHCASFLFGCDLSRLVKTCRHTHRALNRLLYQCGLNNTQEFRQRCLTWAAGKGSLETLERVFDYCRLDQYHLFDALIAACWYGHRDIVQRLLENGAPTDIPPEEEDAWKNWNPTVNPAHRFPDDKTPYTGPSFSMPTPLRFAISRDHVDIVAHLLTRGAKIDIPDVYGEVAIHTASHATLQRSCVSLLLEAGADVNARNTSHETPLNKATKTRRWDLNATIIDDLLNGGADFTAQGGDNASMLLNIVTYARDVECLRVALKHGIPLMPTISPSELLLAATAAGNEDIVHQLLQRSDIDTSIGDINNHTAQMLALKHGHENLLRLLMPYVEENMYTWTNYSGQTLLHFAILSERISMVQFILDNTGGLLDFRDRQGRIPLHTALVRHEYNPCMKEIIRLLVDAGTELELLDCQGRSPFHLAIATGDIEILRFFLDTLKLRGGNSADKEMSAPWTTLDFNYSPERRELHRSIAFVSHEDYAFRNGPVLDLMDSNGVTPLRHALNKQREDMAELLLSYGALPVEEGENGPQNEFYNSMARIRRQIEREREEEERALALQTEQ